MDKVYNNEPGKMGENFYINTEEFFGILKDNWYVNDEFLEETKAMCLTYNLRL